VTSREAYRIAYAAMVFALVVACTPAAEESAPVAEAPAITAPADTATGPAAPNTADTLATAPPEQTTAPPAASAATAPAATPEELVTGRAAYSRTCAMCHGARGEGTPAAAAIASRDAAVIADKITKGAINPGDRMPPMAAMMAPGELDAVAKFVAAGLPQ
jgi:mono/diheme cytochrome c family protein